MKWKTWFSVGWDFKLTLNFPKPFLYWKILRDGLLYSPLVTFQVFNYSSDQIWQSCFKPYPFGPTRVVPTGTHLSLKHYCQPIHLSDSVFKLVQFLGLLPFLSKFLSIFRVILGYERCSCKYLVPPLFITL